MSYALSDNGLKAILEIGRWAMAGIAVAAIWVQSSNQHAEKIEAEKNQAAATKEQTKMFKAALERKPLVFGKDQ